MNKPIKKPYSKVLSNIIPRTIFNKDQNNKQRNGTLIPGLVNFERPKTLENFKLDNSRFYIKNQSVVDTLRDFSSIEILDNNTANYYYINNTQINKIKQGIPRLKKIINSTNFEPEDCDLKSQKYSQFSGTPNNTGIKKQIEMDSKSRLEYLSRIIQYETRYSDICKSLLSTLSSVIQQKNKEIIHHTLINSFYLKRLGLNQSQIFDMYYMFLYSEINDAWFKKETFVEDKMFQVSCEVLHFLSIKDFTVIDNWDTLEIHLKSSIDMLRELDFTFALEYKFAIIHKVLENISFLIHYVNETKILPGNEEILVVFIWCVIQAKCQTMKSNFRFLLLFVNDDQKMGELGFAITQLEAAIVFIGKIVC